MATEYIDTYYKRTLGEAQTYYAPLAGTAEADVCVVGAGLAGLSTALELARRGRAVTLLEARRIAWGASGRNGGSVSPAFSAGADAIRRHVDEDHYRQLYRLSMEGVEIIRDNIRDLRIADAHKVDGRLRVVRYEAAEALRRYCEDQRRDFQRDVRLLSRAEVRERLLSDAYFQGIEDPASFHFHPLNYARALARECARLGVRIHEDSPVTQARLDGAVKQLRTAAGQVDARTVVLATGGYTGDVVPALRRAMLPIATYIMLTEPLGDRVREAISAPRPRSATTAARATITGCSMAGASAGAVESPPVSMTRPIWPSPCAANCSASIPSCRGCASRPRGPGAWPTRGI